MLRTDLVGNLPRDKGETSNHGKGKLMNRYVVTPVPNRKAFNPISFTAPTGPGTGGLEEKPESPGSR